MAYDVIEEACTLDTDTGTPTRDEPPGVAADTGVREQLAGVDSRPARRVVAGVREPEPSTGAANGTGTSDATPPQPTRYADAETVSQQVRSDAPVGNKAAPDVAEASSARGRRVAGAGIRAVWRGWGGASTQARNSFSGVAVLQS